MSESYGIEDMGDEPYRRSEEDDWSGDEDAEEEAIEGYEQQSPSTADAIDRH